jgi:glyoxylase-like metal-dependent hydrolase (beta-lactamase superfamily II)
MFALPQSQIPGVYHRRVGDVVVTALSDGYLKMDREMTRGLPPEDLGSALRAAFRDELVFSVNCFLVRSRDRLALIDTGSGNYLGPTTGGLVANMIEAGVTPADVDTVLLTHIHPDHSSGLTDNTSGTRNFPNAELVVDALVMALARTTPDADGLIHHSDRGSQYTSLDFCTTADLAGLQVSFGSTGDCFDNAAMETIWATLKREIAWIRGSVYFDTRDDAKLFLFEFIEVFYNRQRHQTVLDHHTPVEYAARFAP